MFPTVGVFFVVNDTYLCYLDSRRLRLESCGPMGVKHVMVPAGDLCHSCELRLVRRAAALLLPFALAVSVGADTAYYRRVFFDNSLTPDSYFYSAGKAAAPSLRTLLDSKLPVETRIFFTPPNALRLEWTSQPGGGWVAQIGVLKFRNREIKFDGDVLSFWCFAPRPIGSAGLPLVRIEDISENFSGPLPLAKFSGALPAGRWVQVKIPLRDFATASIRPLHANHLGKLIFSQSFADDAPHILIIDQITIEDSRHGAAKSALPAPQQVTATGYERHIDIAWKPVASERLRYYVIYRSLDGKPFAPIGIQESGLRRYTDFLGETGQTASYKVAAVSSDGLRSRMSSAASASTRPLTDDELLTMLQTECFRYDWESSGPHSGMTRENVPGDDRVVATGASGFGILALIVGMDRGFITRAQGIARLNKMVGFLERAPRYHGAWSHFMDDATGASLPVFNMFDDGGDLVETAFLMEGLLTARQYLNQSSGQEKVLYDRISHLWETVEWDWYRQTPQSDALYWHWSPQFSWYINHRLTGFNEVMIVYLLAIASPTHGVPADLYYSGWAGQSKAAMQYRAGWSGTKDGDRYLNGHTYYGIKLDVGVGSGGPLFFTHYSYMGFDPHAAHDRYTNYFENNRNIALINYAYCVEDPGHFKGYGPGAWGLTASDDQLGYAPHAPDAVGDNG